jgi:maleate isomerase
MERELGIPIYDSVATVVWKALTTVGTDPRALQGWGRLFAERSPAVGHPPLGECK